MEKKTKSKSRIDQASPSVTVSCDSELVVGVVLGLAADGRDLERGRDVPGEQRSRRYDDESSPGRSRSVASEDGGDERDRETARESHRLGQSFPRSPAAVGRRSRQMLRHRTAHLYGSADGPDRLLVSVRAAGWLSASRWSAHGRALHVQRTVRGRGRGRSLRGYGRVLSQPGRRTSALLHAYGESIRFIGSFILRLKKGLNLAKSFYERSGYFIIIK